MCVCVQTWNMCGHTSVPQCKRRVLKRTCKKHVSTHGKFVQLQQLRGGRLHVGQQGVGCTGTVTQNHTGTHGAHGGDGGHADVHDAWEAVCKTLGQIVTTRSLGTVQKVTQISQ